ncbi:methylenetetrahydrofolate dehydrogenase (NADP+)/methenyltetrahydrofolate cyclohydrolase [Anaerosolibacter carboniphilus]|uniref:Bifunctional protein FolD n=1 Tax=Anaerosolibacter carboniphilus TaxID=1417629 RepID=A0A841KXA1_9FIRM|nr:bifunctional methylenetetrahydrofolate dehydrogenase/methenyltetrahydrofolate cyclohydrolase FolD [Anaerosolibacter carboniphilus]MBB6216630.1 methylenetetrahydrofolate dehydrogenase (NADP+)/methenyltetrahydrofolate cyclohydrolase [Anaerosolibacter carboniphilus]
MTAKVLDGKKFAKEIKENLAKEIKELYDSKGIVPGLAVVLAGDDDASQVYVDMKEKACASIGMYSKSFRLPSTVAQSELLDIIDQLNRDDKIHGILIQLPLPEAIDEKVVSNRIHPEKDIDGFHPINNGRLLLGEGDLAPCTPLGIIELIKSTGIEISGKHAVVIGRSNIVGKPTGMLLLKENATVTICHSKTKDLALQLKEADIIVSAVGIPNLVRGYMVKEGAIVIDAGTRVVDNKLVGDVNYTEVEKIASWITPVPGGVGPMTIAMLLRNTFKAALKR